MSFPAVRGCGGGSGVGALGVFVAPGVGWGCFGGGSKMSCAVEEWKERDGRVEKPRLNSRFRLWDFHQLLIDDVQPVSTD